MAFNVFNKSLDGVVREEKKKELTRLIHEKMVNMAIKVLLVFFIMSMVSMAQIITAASIHWIFCVIIVFVYSVIVALTVFLLVGVSIVDAIPDDDIENYTSKSN